MAFGQFDHAYYNSTLRPVPYQGDGGRVTIGAAPKAQSTYYILPADRAAMMSQLSNAEE